MKEYLIHEYEYNQIYWIEIVICRRMVDHADQQRHLHSKTQMAPFSCSRKILVFIWIEQIGNREKLLKLKFNWILVLND